MKETDPGAPEQEALELFQDYITYYRAGGRDGRLWACRQPAVTQKARQLLASGARQPRGLSLYEEAVTGGSSQGLLGQGEDVCPRLVPALEFLELVCVNLFLLPWRREIKSLKTFTGNFVYSVRSVLPENIVEMILKKIGYVALTATEFSLVRKINEEEAMQTAFEIFLTRVECETILEMSSDSGYREEAGALLQSAQPSGLPKCRKDMENHPSKVMENHPSKDMENHPDQVSKFPSKREKDNLLSNLRNAQKPVDKDKSESLLNEETEDGCHLKSDLSLPRGPSPTDVLPHDQEVVQDISKCSESDEFLNRYRDIFIGQTPIFPKNLPPSSQRKPQAQGGCADQGILVSSKAAVSRVTSILPPVASSGPPALTVFTDPTSDDSSKVPGPQVRPKPAEVASFGTATRPTLPDTSPEPHPTNVTLCNNAPWEDDWSSEDDLDDLSSSFSRLQIKAHSTESLEYSIEENLKVTNSQATGSPNHSEGRHKCLDVTSTIHPTIQPASELGCGLWESGCSESRRQQLQRATPSFRQVQEPPNITYIPPRSLEVFPPDTTICTHRQDNCR
ncbi:spermatogenesis-associated protein 2 [Sarcophilus harrisii]|uniref:Spermatogenesis-associated protein 2 PUB-like domain-containing protein n=1 Tax=Sarcophilus harrisii TaxID=9305 RepID=A0A7N4P488_SARHA|nr:spermatogenesis-associated protein 2 [Sarcophilus harrisii]